MKKEARFPSKRRHLPFSDGRKEGMKEGRKEGMEGGRKEERRGEEEDGVDGKLSKRKTADVGKQRQLTSLET